MAAGWSRIRVFSPTGVQIDELDAPTQRSWVLNSANTTQVGRCQFTLPTYSSASGGGYYPKTTLANLNYGNYLFVEHKPSVNADGTTNGKLPDWVGIILTPQTWEYGKITVTAYAAEQVLGFRPVGGTGSGVFNDGATGGGLYTLTIRTINQLWNALGPTIPIQLGNIEFAGRPFIYTLKVDALKEIRTFAALTNQDWDITGQVSAGGQLQLFANWYQRKGYDAGVVLSNLNIQNASPLYTEQGQFYNTVYAYCSSTSNGNRVFAISQDAAGVAANGVLATVITFPNTDGIGQAALQALADNYLQTIKNPTRTFAPTMLDVGNAFSYAAPGNTFIVQNDNVGFQSGGIGINATCRVTAVEYDELHNMVKMAVAL